MVWSLSLSLFLVTLSLITASPTNRNHRNKCHCCSPSEISLIFIVLLFNSGSWTKFLCAMKQPASVGCSLATGGWQQMRTMVRGERERERERLRESGCPLQYTCSVLVSANDKTWSAVLCCFCVCYLPTALLCHVCA